MARWRRVSRAAGHTLVVWLAATATLAVLAMVIPGLRLGGRGPGPVGPLVAAALAAGVFGLLSAVLWPRLVRTLLLAPALVLALLVFVLNGGMVLLALQLVPEDYGVVDLPSAVVVAAALSVTTSATHGALAARDPRAYRRRLARMAGRPAARRLRRLHAPADELPPGLLFLQLDGVSHDVLRHAVLTGYLPTIAGWLGAGSHRLISWRTDWSSQTGAAQLAILHGSNHDVPAFRWYEKPTRRMMICNRPATAAELERRCADRRGLLAPDGASRGNMFTGGAASSAAVISVFGRPNRRGRAEYFAYFSDPASATRTVLAFVAEMVRELIQAVRQRWRDDRPRVRRGGMYPLIRAFATIVERDVVVAAVVGDVLAGRPVVYADLVGYDEVAHHSGVRRPETLAVLRRLDRCLADIAAAARFAPRRYELVVLSDHGQSEGTPFADRYGQSLAELVRSGCRGRNGRRRPVPFEDPSVDTGRGAEARTVARLAIAGRHAGPDPALAAEPDRASTEPIVLASGNLGLVSFPEVDHRMTMEEIEQLHPDLLDTLAKHPGIGFILVRSARRGALAIGADGVHELDTGVVHRTDPLAVFGHGAAATVRRTDSFPHCGDIMINSSYSPATGEVHSFEEQIGSHGGLGGGQNEPFLLYPLRLPAPTEPLVGAESIHRLFAGWRDGLRPGPLAEPPATASQDRARRMAS